ncbi:MAG TPA: CdaR family protein [Candidatus Polarisedimenticolaceae bacterium]|nr:CdaR family protein [Candidatus Polarisedimenticolaceae bacterium]
MLDAILRRWHLKLLALGLAFAVWVAVTGEGRGVQDFRVPVDVVTGPQAALAGPPPTNVTVRLRGPESLLRRLDPYDLAVRVDLRDGGSGDRTVPLTPRNVTGVPLDVEVALIEPDRLRLSVAKRKKRDVPVVATIVGKPPRGYHVYRAIARPEALQVEGPEAKLSAAARLATDPIRVDGRSEPFVARVGAVADGADLRVVDARPLDVTVYIDLAPVDAAFDRVPIVPVGAQGAVTLVPSTVGLTISAPSGLLPKLRAGRLRVVADVAAATKAGETTSAPLRVEFPGLEPEERAKVTVRGMSRRTADVRRGGL